MRGQNPILAYGAAAGLGLARWACADVVTGKAEPWDAPNYWTVFYPLAVIGAALLGFVFPQRPWRWAVTLMLMQVVVMTATGSGFGLLPLGIVMLLVLAVPGALAAMAAARLRELR